MNRLMINGVKVYPFTSFESLIAYVLEHPGILVAINAGKISKATDTTRALINRNIGYCDGVGAVKALKRLGVKNARKLAGCELWLKIIESTLHSNSSYYFVGGKQEIIDEVIQKLQVDFPGINICGYRNGYISSEEERELLIADIAVKRPKVVFVAMGSPKQELLMEEMQKVNPDAIFQGLGGSFDVYVGKFKRAPQWWIDHNLEGVYRNIHDPNWKRFKRLWDDFVFIMKLYLGKYDGKTINN